ncbi:MAG TPA: LPS export ABC transporter permease LptG [Rhizomicrobium sp.]|jgi:lipopolysaccharide export system permease protein|nr:LPS export ABC transporter permease LptG [Rhizomicrobium sp.]
MSWSWTLYQYLARQFLTGVGLLFATLSFLAFSIDLVDLLDRTGGRHVPAAAVISMALLQVPDLALKLLPFAVLLGGIFAFARLSRSHELQAIRAAGVSAWNLLAAPVCVAIALGVLAVTLFTPLAARLLVQFTAMEARLIRGQASQLAISQNGLWLRQGDANAQSVIHALRVADQGTKLEDVTIFLYGGADNFRGRIDAQSGSLIRGAWRLSNGYLSGPSGEIRRFQQYSLPTPLTPTRIQESFAAPDTLSFWALPGFIDAARQAGFSATRYLLYYDSLLMLPAMFAAMVLISASFSLRLARLGGLSRTMVLGALAGFSVYFLSAVTRALGESGILPVALAAAAPAMAAILFGMTLVFHHEDG